MILCELQVICLPVCGHSFFWRGSLRRSPTRTAKSLRRPSPDVCSTSSKPVLSLWKTSAKACDNFKCCLKRPTWSSAVGSTPTCDSCGWHKSMHLNRSCSRLPDKSSCLRTSWPVPSRTFCPWNHCSLARRSPVLISCWCDMPSTGPFSAAKIHLWPNSSQDPKRIQRLRPKFSTSWQNAIYAEFHRHHH